ncbi:GlsB/YeaQ/YmgE family stress response membrane protein [Altericroceibacterium xinjiangense]|uniref:GlsB/YeaQ/YmgE family stress response membrane protein n=1 Tax=Altericroceibacterium xinjiangense TaxID=762261 RepID=UPI000F7E937D|nr:GlsB/YeaQ/YmgE family stress response membrane protein [Altericroceibacterium xinjiangense]
MGVIFLIVVGAVFGWLGSIVMRAEENQAILLNAAAGVGGALIAGVFVSPLLGRGDLAAGVYSVAALLLSVLGAIVAIVALNLFRRQVAR